MEWWNWIWKSRGFRLCGLILLVITGISGFIWLLLLIFQESLTPLQKAEQLLQNEIILIDGRNNFASTLREYFHNDLSNLNFTQNLSDPNIISNLLPKIHQNNHKLLPFQNIQTDLLRMKAGAVKAQFWVARSECSSQHEDAVEITLEQVQNSQRNGYLAKNSFFQANDSFKQSFNQIDVIKRLIDKNSNDMALVTSYEELVHAIEQKKIASFISICCGHSIQWSFAILRQFYELGVRSMTFPQICSTPWADASAEFPNPNPILSPFTHGQNPKRTLPVSDGTNTFGDDVVYEMNRLGMIIDLSWTSFRTMHDVLSNSKAPVIFSHSGSSKICDKFMNVPEAALKLVRQKESLVMVSFFPYAVGCDPIENATVADVIKHLDYLREKITIDNIGIGSDFDPPPDHFIAWSNRSHPDSVSPSRASVTESLEDTSKFPNLFAALIETGRWSESDLEKIAGKNLIRVLQEVEKVKEAMKNFPPKEYWIDTNLLDKAGYDFRCSSRTSSKPRIHPGRGKTYTDRDVHIHI